MKHKVLALVIPALMIAGTANASVEVWNQDGNKLSLYGHVKAVDVITKAGNDKGDHTEARLGFTGESQITDSITGYGTAEWQTTAAHDDYHYYTDDSTVNNSKSGHWDNETRYAFAGLNFGNYGSFDYGRNDGLIKSISVYTDVLPEFGGDSSNQPFYLLSDRSSSVATYRNTDFFGLVDGLGFAFQYADRLSVNNPAGELIADKYNRDAYASTLEYSLLDTGISAIAGYAKSTSENYKQTWATGLKYDANNLYLAATYFDARDKSDMTSLEGIKKYWGVEVVAQYGIDFEVGRLTPSLAYIQHKKRHTDHGDIVQYVDVGATYDFNQNVAAIIDYKINLLKNKDLGVDKHYGSAQTKDSIGLGIIYQF